MNNEELTQWVYDCSYEGQYKKAYKDSSKEDLIQISVNLRRTITNNFLKANELREGFIKKIPDDLFIESFDLLGRDDVVDYVIKLQKNHNVVLQLLNLAMVFKDQPIPNEFHPNSGGIMGIY